MPNTVKFEVSADVAAAVNAVLKVVGATDKVAEGFTKSAQASDRASRKMQADARATVAKIQATTGSSAFTGQGWNVAIARSAAARQIRSDRFLARSRTQDLGFIGQISANQRDLRELRERNQAEAARVKGFQDEIDFNNFSTKMQKMHAAKAYRMSQAKWAGGIALTAGAYAVNQTAQSFQENKERTIAFADDFRKVASLGDNIDNITGKRQQVLAFSAAWGVASEKITAAMYSIESAASNLTKGEQADILTGAMQFNRLQGADPEFSGKAILKYKQIWGTGVNEAKNRIFRTADIGDVDIDKMSMFGPDLWAKAQASGFGKTDVDAMTDVATQKLGRTEKTFTGLGDVLMKLPKVGAALGLNLNRDRSFLDQLAPLMDTQAGRDRLGAENAFGTDVGVVQALVSGRRDVGTYAQQLDESANGDPVAEKLNKLLSDTTMHFAEMSGVLEQLNKNMPVSKDFAAKWGQQSTDLDAAEVGFQQMLGPNFKWLASPLAWMSQTKVAGWKVGDLGIDSITGEGKTFGDVARETGMNLGKNAADDAGRAGVFGSTGSRDISSNSMYMTAEAMAKADGTIPPDEQAGLDALIASLKNAASAAEAMRKPRAPRDTNAHN